MGVCTNTNILAIQTEGAFGCCWSSSRTTIPRQGQCCGSNIASCLDVAKACTVATKAILVAALTLVAEQTRLHLSVPRSLVTYQAAQSEDPGGVFVGRQGACFPRRLWAAPVAWRAPPGGRAQPPEGALRRPCGGGWARMKLQGPLPAKRCLAGCQPWAVPASWARLRAMAGGQEEAQRRTLGPPQGGGHPHWALLPRGGHSSCLTYPGQ